MLTLRQFSAFSAIENESVFFFWRSQWCNVSANLTKLADMTTTHKYSASKIATFDLLYEPLSCRIRDFSSKVQYSGVVVVAAGVNILSNVQTFQA
ncbi:hypothetical protein [Calothrix sp. 336/3]|uniref:hypothetical protein n=1 Tax=Calothrix sp. 336/3 TaxID=1337936 RepID=UPI00143ABB60|nr:hypothetical protein [Calothrix sp. 336/3]